MEGSTLFDTLRLSRLGCRLVPLPTLDTLLLLLEGPRPLRKACEKSLFLI